MKRFFDKNFCLFHNYTINTNDNDMRLSVDVNVVRKFKDFFSRYIFCFVFFFFLAICRENYASLQNTVGNVTRIRSPYYRFNGVVFSIIFIYFLLIDIIRYEFYITPLSVYSILPNKSVILFRTICINIIYRIIAGRNFHFFLWRNLI